MTSKCPGRGDAGTERAAPPRWLPSLFHPLAYPGFFLLWLGQVSRSLAIWMDMVARPALVLGITGSALQLGLIAVIRGGPMLVIGPFAGLAADRVNRRVVMLLSKGLDTVVNATFTVLILTGRAELWHVYATAAIKSVSQAFDRPARQALLPDLVPSRLLVSALALNSGSMQVTRIGSASVAGFAIAIWSAGFGYTADDPRSFGGVYLLVTLAYAAGLLATLFLRVPPNDETERVETSWLGSLLEGFRFAVRSPIILSIFILLTVRSLFGLPYLQVFVPWIALQVMEIGPEGMGILIGMSGIGALAGAVVLAAMGERLRRRGRLVIGALLLYGLGLTALGLTSVLPPVTVAGLVVPVVPMLMITLVGLGQATVMTLKNAVLVEHTPSELRGRIFSLQSIDRSLSTVGSGMAGVTIAAVGGSTGLAIYGGLCALGALAVALAFPALRRAD